MRKYLKFALVLSLFSIAVAEELKVYACGVTRVAFMKELNSAFAKKYNINIKTNKSGGDLFVIKEVNDKKVDLATGCREPLETLKDEKDVDSIQIAWGALSFIVNPKNKIENLTTKQIKDILIGKIRNWKEVGGDDREIHLIVRESKRSGVGLSARETLFKNRDVDFYSKAKKVKSSGFVRNEVAKDIDAFAIDNTMSSSKHNGIKMLKVNGVEPTKENILKDKYKMRQALYLYLPKNPSKMATKYAKFALGKEGQDIISKTGTANLAEASGKDDEDNYMIQNLLIDLE
jgi:phosphate transport system substrate-binding protein